MKMAVSALLFSLSLAGCHSAEPDVAPADSPEAKVKVVDPVRAPTPASTPAAAAAVPTPSHWQCEELRLSVEVRHGDGAQLAFSGRKLMLANATPGSGARYADRAGNEFLQTGDHATLVLIGQPKRSCERTAQMSAWNEATARGIAFRAVGNEPGWFVEVNPGDAPRLHATLDYGERKIEVTKVQALSGLLGWAGRTADGTEVRLLVERAACQDGMSAELFEAKAELTVASQRYDGCGAFLAD